ncbi:arylsulfatase [Vibrio diazotrophicus]|uniref:arylsulfatase n=1 Tax=Vibrio diazotrophicus TaxID=685 RepID=UPI00142E7856|nr:arylsulfatase [Vibrio diazotrophicus]NIY92130.1 arylsulfatase [Vibrio diazotrophicus]
MKTKIKPIVAITSFLISSASYAEPAKNIDRTVLPIQQSAQFNGKIGTTFDQSKSDYPQPIKAPEGAPNVVVILLDDLGFGQAGTFGGLVPTPNIDKLASRGVTYNNFHTTGISSPTRAALLTGRNHHQVGFGTISELSTGFPGYNSIWPKSVASIAEVLKDNGYSTSAFGKWHNTPDWETSSAGPFEQWPTGLGFQHFYGFQGGETSQWEPQLFNDTTPIELTKKPEDGYQLNEDLVDKAIAWIDQQKSMNPDKPYFTYFAPGAVHAPLHAPKEWIAKFKGKFDMGWDKYREEVFARQKAMGMIPQNTKLTPRPKEIEAWDTLSADQKRLYARHMEVFAAFLAYTDYEVGRLLDKIESMPDSDNTMIMYIAGDNGSSAEGSITGTTNNMMTQNSVPDTVEDQLKVIDELGSELHENHYPVGWAWAGTTPFQWMKRVPSHFGGTRNGLVVSWPAKIKNTGTIQSQFHHVVDITPTILQAANIPAPTSVNGVKQKPMAGTSMIYTFNHPEAKSHRTVQYFETGGHRAIYKDGWVAASFHGVPWQLSSSLGFKDSKWELYNVKEDFSEAVDLSKKNPEKLKELIKEFDKQAKINEVYPLDDRFTERASTPDRPSITRGKTQFSYTANVTRVPEGSAPKFYQRDHRIDAYVTVDKNQKADGVLMAIGGGSGGLSFYADNGKLVYGYNFFGKSYSSIKSDSKIPSGKVKLSAVYKQQPFRFLKDLTGGTVDLYINDKKVGSGKVEKAVPVRFSATETLDIGVDLGAPVMPTYRKKLPYQFNGVIEKVDVETAPTQPIIK